MTYHLTKLQKIKDARGELIIFLTDTELEDAKKRFGQIYFVTFKKRGEIRGNHYHKKWYEWFGVVTGRVEVFLADVRTGKKQRVVLDAKKDQYVRLETGPYIAHTIRSLTKGASLLSYADTRWQAGDTFEYTLLPEV